MANTTIEAIIQKITQSIANTYAMLYAMGASEPATENSDNLAATAGTVKVLRYDAQSLTDAQKTQAKSNIGAVSKSGDTMTGALVAQNNSNYTTAQVRNVVFVPEGNDPPATNDGDFILFYQEPDA